MKRTAYLLIAALLVTGCASPIGPMDFDTSEAGTDTIVVMDTGDETTATPTSSGFTDSGFSAGDDTTGWDSGADATTSSSTSTTSTGDSTDTSDTSTTGEPDLPAPDPVCGDGVVEGNEECEPGQLLACTDQMVVDYLEENAPHTHYWLTYYDSPYGSAECASDCTWDTTTCGVECFLDPQMGENSIADQQKVWDLGGCTRITSTEQITFFGNIQLQTLTNLQELVSLNDTGPGGVAFVSLGSPSLDGLRNVTKVVGDLNFSRNNNWLDDLGGAFFSLEEFNGEYRMLAPKVCDSQAYALLDHLESVGTVTLAQVDGEWSC